MKKFILIIIPLLSIICDAKNITVSLYEDINIDIPIEANIENKTNLVTQLPNNSLQSLYDFENGIVLNLSDGVILEIDVSDNAKTSKQMNSLSTLNWLIVVSTYTNMINKNVKKKQEQGYKTASTLTGDRIGKYRVIISRLGWATEKGINNLFISDIFHEKAMLSIKVTWVSDQSNSETVADQVISSLSIANLK